MQPYCDVNSLIPHLPILQGYQSRTRDFPKIFLIRSLLNVFMMRLPVEFA